MKRLSSLDAAFWFAETPTGSMTIGGLAVCDPSGAPHFSFDAVKNLIASRLPEMPVLQCRVAGAPFGLDRPWLIEDTRMDLDYHIRRVAVPPPGGRRELESLIGTLMSYPLDRSRPLWELWFIEGIEDGRVAYLTKMHHATVDGVSGAGLSEIMLDATPEPRLPAVRASGSPSSGLPGIDRRILGAFVNVAVMTPYRGGADVPADAVSAARRAGTGQQATAFLRSTCHTLQRRTDCSAQDHDGPGASGAGEGGQAGIRCEAQRCCAGARFGCDPELSRGAGELPDRPLVASVPVSTHSDASPTGNQITSMTISLATDVDDPAQRLKAIYDSSQGAKEMAKALTAHQIMGLTEITPPGLLGLAVRAYTASHLGGRLAPINLVLSNVPGPEFPIYMAGALVERVIPIGPLLLGVGLNITCFSYRGSLDFGLVTTPEIADDIDQLADSIEPALKELEHAAGLTG